MFIKVITKGSAYLSAEVLVEQLNTKWLDRLEVPEEDFGDMGD